MVALGEEKGRYYYFDVYDSHDVVIYSISTNSVQTSRAGVPHWLDDSERKSLTHFPYHSYFRKFVKVYIQFTVDFSMLEHAMAGMESRQITRQAFCIILLLCVLLVLLDDLYSPVDPASIPSNQQTAYKWSFASNRSRVNEDELRRVREAVGGDTYGTSASSSQASKGTGRMQGPTLPSAADLQLAREDAVSYANMTHLAKRKRERGEDKERVEDIVGPKEVGREGLIEKKRVKREGDRAFREAKEDGGLEVSEDLLMGGGSSFKERCASTCSNHFNG